MTEFLSQHGVLGLVVGFLTFLIIGVFHPLVIKGYYHFGLACRSWFFIAGIAAGVGSYFVPDVVWSTLLGVLSFTCLWSVLEVTEQKTRVERGWFPANPKHVKKSDSESDSKN